MTEQESRLRVLPDAPPHPVEVPIIPGYQTPAAEQEWYEVAPRGQLFARHVPKPSTFRGRYYEPGSYYIWLQRHPGVLAQLIEVVSEIEFRRRYTVTGEAELDTK